MLRISNLFTFQENAKSNQLAKLTKVRDSISVCNTPCWAGRVAPSLITVPIVASFKNTRAVFFRIASTCSGAMKARENCFLVIGCTCWISRCRNKILDEGTANKKKRKRKGASGNENKEKRKLSRIYISFFELFPSRISFPILPLFPFLFLWSRSQFPSGPLKGQTRPPRYHPTLYQNQMILFQRRYAERNSSRANTQCQLLLEHFKCLICFRWQRYWSIQTL